MLHIVLVDLDSVDLACRLDQLFHVIPADHAGLVPLYGDCHMERPRVLVLLHCDFCSLIEVARELEVSKQKQAEIF